MKNTRKLIFTAVCLVLIIATLAVSTFAWFLPMQDSMVLVAGDMKIKVLKARYAFAFINSDNEEELLVGSNGVSHYDILNETRLNTVPLASDETYVIYEFVVQNLSLTDATLSLRLSDFSDYMFKGLTEYYNAVAVEEIADPEISVPCANYTAKTIFNIKYLKYAYNFTEEDIDAESRTWKDSESTATLSDRQLWKFSYGDYIFGKEGIYDAIKLKAKMQEDEEPGDYSDCVTLRLAIDNNFDVSLINEFYDWLENGEYVRNYCNNILSDKEEEGKEDIITSYLAKVLEMEKAAFNEALHSEGLTGGFQLTINYFEFAGENIPFNDNEIKDQDQNQNT